MSKFAAKYGFLVAAMALAFGETNAAIEYDEVNNAATLSSEQLGAINKHMGDLKTQLKDANEAAAKTAEQHEAALKAKEDQIAALKQELEEAKETTPAESATTTGQDRDKEPVANVDWIDMNAEHNQAALKYSKP